MTAPQHLLCIETGFPGLGLILIKAEQGQWMKLDESYQAEPQAATRFVTASCRDLLYRHSLRLNDLHGVVINLGPGSFTGIKIGLAFVHGLKAGHPHLKIYPNHTLGLLQRHGAVHFSKPLVHNFVFLGATRTQGYCAFSSNLTAERVSAAESDHRVTLAACSVEGTQISFRFQEETGYDLDFQIPAQSSCVVIDSWPSLEESLVANGHSLTKIAPGELLGIIGEGVVKDLGAHVLLPQDTIPRPLFLRRSAPEEKLLPPVKL